MAKSERHKPTPPVPPARVHSVRRVPFQAIGLAALLWLVTFVAYRPAASAGFIWDDDDYIEQRFTLWSPTGLADIWLRPEFSPQYYPLVFTTFRIEWHLWQFNPRGYHEVNIFLHAMSAILLWRILKRLELPGAYFVAAVFAAHPVMVESVAWVTERKNTLSLLFYLLSLRMYLDFTFPAQSSTAAARWRRYGLAIFFFICALLSKTVTSSLPAAMLLLIWWKRGKITLSDVWPLLPFFALGVCGGLITSKMERDHVGASGAEWNFSFPQRLLIASRALWFYAQKLLLPVHLSFVYAKWNIEPARLINWLFPVALLLVIGVLFVLRRRIGRGPLVAVLLFAGTLFPALGFVNVFPMRYTFAADHYQYHASIAFLVLVCAGLTLLARRMFGQVIYAAVGAGACIVLLLAGLTFARSRVYKDRFTLWTDTATKNDHWMVWGNLGNEAINRKPPDKAAAAYYYRKSLERGPDVPDTHYCMGQAYDDMNDHVNAEREFRRAVEIAPRYADGHDMLGYSLRKLKRDAEAETHFRLAIQNNPVHYRAMFNLGVLLKDHGRLEEAVEMFRAGLRVNPRHVPSSEHLGDAYRRMKRPLDAIAAYEHILSFQPKNADALFNAALLLAITGQQNRAADYLQQALKIKPELRNRLPQR